MPVVSAEITERAALAVQTANRHGKVVGAFLFGSHVDGQPNKWSDIDLALFIEGVDDWDLTRRAEVSGAIWDEVGCDIEPHYFPAESLTNYEPSSFVAFILKHGVQIPIDGK